MEERSLRVLEFPLFLQGLRTYAASEVGQALCLSLRPSARKEEVENRLKEVTEASDLLKEEGDIPLGGVLDVRPILIRARAEGTCLAPEDLLPIEGTAGAAGRTKQFLEKAGNRRFLLIGWAEKIPDLRDLNAALHSSIGPHGEILDSASPELGRIRREISLVRARIRKTLEALWDRDNLSKIFQEQIITLRNERYVVAVKAEFKNILPGIVHDHSQSRATFFIEPLSTLEENNELSMLLKDEKEEERRILLELTSLVREQTKELHRAVEVLGYLDLLMAKARWARVFRGSPPLLNDQGSWHLRDARHPLLEPKAIPIDLELGNGESTLVITGANTGGKTAALKTLGLLTLIAQSGIPIPAAEGSEVAVFRRIFADIGDEQDLRENLSTFSAWVRTLSRILEESDSSSLVLLDEVGGGTDPAEGAALTMALIDILRARGAKTVVTTHLQLLKAYGSIHPDVVNVSVEFNPETLRPTYRLVYGRPGESHALLMAEKWGLPHELVQRAYGYLGEGELKVSQLLQNLEKSQHELEEKLQEAEEVKREAEGFRKQAEAFVRQTRREEEHLLFQAREETQVMIRQAREDLRRLINDFKSKGRTDLHRLRQDIQAVEERLGQGVWEKSGEDRSPGELAGANPKPVSLPATLAQLREVFTLKSGKVKEKAKADSPGLIDFQIPPASREIKVIGLRVEEAIPLVDKAIDDAFLAGLKELEVIHGAGTGRLREAIRDHLKEHPLVRAFLPGGPGRGGNGVTVVEISSSLSTQSEPHR